MRQPNKRDVYESLILMETDQCKITLSNCRFIENILSPFIPYKYHEDVRIMC